MMNSKNISKSLQILTCLFAVAVFSTSCTKETFNNVADADYQQYEQQTVSQEGVAPMDQKTAVVINDDVLVKGFNVQTIEGFDLNLEGIGSGSETENTSR